MNVQNNLILAGVRCGRDTVLEADKVRWVKEPVMTQRRRAWVRCTRFGCIWGLAVWQGQRQIIFVYGAQSDPPNKTRRFGSEV